MSSLFYTTFSSPIGEIFLTARNEKIVGLWIHGQPNETLTEKTVEAPQLPILRKGKEWIHDYFENKRPSIAKLPLAPEGNLFRQTVWQQLIKIPYGVTTTYGDIARHVASIMGKEKMSPQAIGNAVGHNPISIIIPCHRVIGTQGNLIGYAGGLNLKIQLLTHEKVDMNALYVPKCNHTKF